MVIVRTLLLNWQIGVSGYEQPEAVQCWWLCWLAGKNLVLTNQPYFYKKAELFPDSTFVVGVDTAIRLMNVSLFLHVVPHSWCVAANVNFLACCMPIDKWLEGDGSSFADFVKSVIVFECEDVLIWQPKYYGESKTRMLEVLLGIHQQGCDFMVAGRKVDGRFKVCQSLWFSCSVWWTIEEILKCRSNEQVYSMFQS